MPQLHETIRALRDAPRGGIRGITDEVLRDIESRPERYPIGSPIRDEIDRLARTHQFFHWHIAFPDVFGAEQHGAALTVGGVRA